MVRPVCSVIVAVYNGAAFLPQCLDSLMAQTLDGVEVIVADDASTDATPEVLADYAARYDTIRTLRLDENHGQAYARNQALKLAQGDYICFLDADDWYDRDALRQAVDVFSRHAHTDCVLFDVVQWFDDHHQQRIPLPQFEVMSGYEAFSESLSWAIHGVYMARRTLYDRYPYDDSCRAYSDDNTTRLHYYISREVRPCGGLYYYRQHEASVTHKAGLRHFDYLRANESMRRQLIDLGVGADVLRRYENQRWLVLVDCWRFYFIHRQRMTPHDRRAARAEMKRVWKTIDTTTLEPRNKWKLGYMPLRPSWRLFCLQEELYFTLKRWLRRL